MSHSHIDQLDTPLYKTVFVFSGANFNSKTNLIAKEHKLAVLILCWIFQQLLLFAVSLTLNYLNVFTLLKTIPFATRRLYQL